jgi:hypothetical protein
MEGGKWSLMDYLHATPFSLSPRLFEKRGTPLHKNNTIVSSPRKTGSRWDGSHSHRHFRKATWFFWKRGKLKNRRMGISNKEPGKLKNGGRKGMGWNY